MPKGYGYDKAPKKPSGFKMTGFSYAGESPVKGKKKKAQIAAADIRSEDALAKIEEMGEFTGESTNLLAGTNTTYGQMPAGPSPLQQGMSGTMSSPPEPPNPNTQSFSDAMTNNSKESNWKKFKSAASSAAGSSMGKAAGEALATGLVNLGVNALKGKDKKERRRVNVAAGFSQIKIGRG